MNLVKNALFGFLAVMILLLPGCVAWGNRALVGLAYTHVRLPFSKNLVHTPAVVIHANGRVEQVKEPISGYGIYAQWNSNAIGDIAARHGLKRVYYADVEIFNVLRVWKREKIHIYGTR
ncbi:MAG: hypothetical protein JRF59_10170 [Deltaproteobacteria bacterium]|nr:hypothetical protein [Deltaproteobacteria bacterium]MBW2348193.1 hypothetical protein [Deltaproteobacteria bacterium]RLB30453.1 MAG: hypothetical protein DRH20_16640 [Deltaproteobacteria bacterium]